VPYLINTVEKVIFIPISVLKKLTAIKAEAFSIRELKTDIFRKTSNFFSEFLQLF
jgi:hypothetical protein